MRILLIEDEDTIEKFLTTGLKAEGFSIDSVTEGTEGVRLAGINDYDCIILDYQLPDISGLMVCEQIRAGGNTTPILGLSVITDVHTKIDLLNAGADDYLTKPFSFNELTARVRALMRRPTTLMGPVLQIDDLMLDTSRHIVTRDEKEIHLTRKEFALLEYLMRNQGIVLSRGLIMEHVWDMSVDPFSNTIDTHILSLRKKLNAGGKKDLIKTVSGKGYKIK